jgi:REP element-mobilizing transposase RayT
MSERFRGRYRIPSARLDGHDYSRNGYYFVTICVQERETFFGDNINGKMKLSEIGLAADKFWREIPIHFPDVIRDEFIIMPDHIHGILRINGDDVDDGIDGVDRDDEVDGIDVETQNFASLPARTTSPARTPPPIKYQNKFGPQSKNLSSIIRGFKIGVTKYANNHDIYFAWQPRFHDHIIRDEKSLNRIRKYIRDNPRNAWHPVRL